VQDHVDEVGGGEALHVLDALLEEPGLVPHAQAVDLVERVRRAERRHEDAQRRGSETLHRLHAHQGEEADHEGDHGGGAVIAVGQDLVQRGHQDEDHNEPQHRVRVRGGPEVALEEPPDEHLQDKGIRAQGTSRSSRRMAESTSGSM
jgi:hypothetical protein